MMQDSWDLSRDVTVDHRPGSVIGQAVMCSSGRMMMGGGAGGRVEVVRGAIGPLDVVDLVADRLAGGD